MLLFKRAVKIGGSFSVLLLLLLFCCLCSLFSFSGWRDEGESFFLCVGVVFFFEKMCVNKGKCFKQKEEGKHKVRVGAVFVCVYTRTNNKEVCVFVCVFYNKLNNNNRNRFVWGCCFCCVCCDSKGWECVFVFFLFLLLFTCVFQCSVCQGEDTKVGKDSRDAGLGRKRYVFVVCCLLLLFAIIGSGCVAA